jgi:ribosomal protein L11 methyltransferase
MDYYKFQVKNSPEFTEALIAFFSLSPFDSFQETVEGFDAFLPAEHLSDDIDAHLTELQQRFDFTYEKEFIEGENWNEVWETNFHSVLVGDFCGIRADFHPPFEKVEHEIVINPQMAFGTGHHETTFSVIQLMQGVDFRHQKVLDYGCGTGILAILAARLGADSLVAVDIEEQSYLNTLENCEKNGVSNVTAIHGKLEDVPQDAYGIVLANINRNVILNSLAALALRLEKGGTILISGFVLSDRTLMEEALEENGFRLVETMENGNWLAMKCRLEN